MVKRVKAVTLTILTESPVPLSYDQGYGNYTPMKKTQYKNKDYAQTSIATMTYELRKILREEHKWTLSNIVLNKSGDKITNLYASPENIDSLDINGLETDIFGYFVPKKGKGSYTKVSPIRIIPLKSVNPYRSGTQLITNKGFLDGNSGRKYYDADGKEIKVDEKFPTTQALAVEEIFGDFYVYTITIELDRVGVLETKDGKFLLPEDREYMPKELREKAVKDIMNALTKLTRNIKHSAVLLKPLAVFGGAFEDVVPYFWNDVEFLNDGKTLNLQSVIDTIESYELESDGLIVAVDRRINALGKDYFEEESELKKAELSYMPVKSIKNLSEKIKVGEDNFWYIGD